MSSTRERAWLAAHQKGSKALIQKLEKAHANNPEYQAFKKKHGLGDTSSVKQVSKSTVDRAKEKARQTLAGKAYGATKGTRMGSAEGTGETLRDTVAPLTRDQHSAVKAAEREAKAAEKPSKPKKEKAAAPAPEKKKPSALELIAAAAAKRKINQPPVSPKALRRIAAVGDMEHDHGGFDDLSDTEYGGRGNRSIDEGMLDDYIEGKIEAHHRAKSKEDLAKSDAAREALSKKVTPLNKKIASIKGSVTYKNKEHPRHSIAAEKLKTARAERAAISAEREKHYNAFAKTRTARDEKIASDTKTYRNFGLVGLGLKKLKQKLTSEESVDEGWFSKKPKQSDMLDDGKGAPAPQAGKKLNVPSGDVKVDPIVSPTKMKREEVEQIDEINNSNGYRVTNSWSVDGQTHKRWDKDHNEGGPTDRHQSTIELWQEKKQKPVYHASHRIEHGYWTNQSSRSSPTKVTFKQKFDNHNDAVAALEKHTNQLYKKHGVAEEVEQIDEMIPYALSAANYQAELRRQEKAKTEHKKNLERKAKEQLDKDSEDTGNPFASWKPVKEARKRHYHGGALFADTAARLQKAINAHKERMDQITNGPEHEYHHPTLDIRAKSRLKLPAPWVKVEDK